MNNDVECDDSRSLSAATPERLAIMKLVHSKPIALTIEQSYELVFAPMPYMGPPQCTEPTGKPGRPSTKTQYDSARERRKNLLGLLNRTVHRKIKLPELGKLGSWLKCPNYVKTLIDVLNDPSVNRCNRVSAVLDRLTVAGLRQPSVRTVQGHVNLDLEELQSNLK